MLTLPDLLFELWLRLLASFERYIDIEENRSPVEQQRSCHVVIRDWIKFSECVGENGRYYWIWNLNIKMLWVYDLWEESFCVWVNWVDTESGFGFDFLSRMAFRRWWWGKDEPLFVVPFTNQYKSSSLNSKKGVISETWAPWAWNTCSYFSIYIPYIHIYVYMVQVHTAALPGARASYTVLYMVKVPLRLKKDPSQKPWDHICTNM